MDKPDGLLKRDRIMILFIFYFKIMYTIVQTLICINITVELLHQMQYFDTKVVEQANE